MRPDDTFDINQEVDKQRNIRDTHSRSQCQPIAEGEGVQRLFNVRPRLAQPSSRPKAVEYQGQMSVPETSKRFAISQDVAELRNEGLVVLVSPSFKRLATLGE